MSSDHGSRLRDLIEQWQDLVVRYRAACRVANHDGNIELDAFRDGKASGMADCIYELDALLRASASAPPEQQNVSDVVRMAMSKIGDRCQHHRLPLDVLEWLTIRECPICWKECAENLQRELDAFKAYRPPTDQPIEVDVDAAAALSPEPAPASLREPPPQEETTELSRLVDEMLALYGVAFTDQNSREVAIKSWARQLRAAACASLREPQKEQSDVE